MARKDSLSEKIQANMKAVGLGSDDPIFIKWCDAIADAVVKEYGQSNTTVIIPAVGDGEDQTGYID
ncbi:MAG: hypothetical protein GY714_10415 [Desulfobacterales bacterium]|nr:hypothetical protein [Desulfobacterales bacterium]